MKGLVIAGGASTRMQQNKALLQYHGMPQYAFVHALLQPYCSEVLVSVNAYNAAIALPQLIDADAFKNQGPMSGLLSAFDYAHTDWLVCAIDYPLFDAIEMQHALQQLNTSSLAHVMHNAQTNFYEPWIGLYKAKMKHVLQQQFLKKPISLQTILRSIDAQAIAPINLHSLQSIDTPEQFNLISQQLR
jgi:molybdenum cofactor guanylyltransferase